MARWERWDPPKLNKRNAVLEWTAEHASLVHEGAQSSDMYYPARPWTDVAINELDTEKFISDNLTDFNIERVFIALVNEFIRLCNEALTSKIWYWYGTTHRRNGQVVEPGKRDAYDLGELYNSLVVSYGQ